MAEQVVNPPLSEKGPTLRKEKDGDFGDHMIMSGF